MVCDLVGGIAGRGRSSQEREDLSFLILDLAGLVLLIRYEGPRITAGRGSFVFLFFIRTTRGYRDIRSVGYWRKRNSVGDDAADSSRHVVPHRVKSYKNKEEKRGLRSYRVGAELAERRSSGRQGWALARRDTIHFYRRNVWNVPSLHLTLILGSWELTTVVNLLRGFCLLGTDGRLVCLALPMFTKPFVTVKIKIIAYSWTVPLILDHSYLVGKITSSKIADTKVSGF